MIFNIKRLHGATESGRRYHLFDEVDHLLLVADQDSAWLADEPPGRVRFARPGGEAIATLDFPKAGGSSSARTISYAIIYNHAVYALFTEVAAGDSLPDYLIEVEGNRWLATREDEDSPMSLNIYDGDGGAYDEEGPSGLIGSVRPVEGDYDFAISFLAESLSQAPLIMLALVVVVESKAP